jgi:hypothetical protein
VLPEAPSLFFNERKAKQKLEFSGIKKIWEHLLSYNQAKKCKTTIRNTSPSSLASILSSSATQNSGISAAFDHQRHISTSLITLPSSQLCYQSLSENVMSSSGINLTFIPLETVALETLLQTAEPRGSRRRRRRRRRLFLGRRVCIAHIRLRTYYFCRSGAALLDLHRQSEHPPSFRGAVTRGALPDSPSCMKVDHLCADAPQLVRWKNCSFETASGRNASAIRAP